MHREQDHENSGPRSPRHVGRKHQLRRSSRLLRHLGFAERVRGSHHIFTRDCVPEILNLQPRGAQAKPYQVKQVRGVIVTHTLAGEPQEEPPAEELSAEGSGLSTSEEREDGE